MAEENAQFDELAAKAGHIVGEAEISMRQAMGDEAFDAYKSNVIRCNAANAQIQENIAKYHASKSAYWGALTMGVAVLTLDSIALVVHFMA